MSQQKDFWKRMGTEAEGEVPRQKRVVMAFAALEAMGSLALIYLGLFYPLDIAVGLVGFIGCAILFISHSMGLVGAGCEFTAMFHLYKYLCNYFLPVVELSGIGFMGFNIYQCFTADKDKYFFCQTTENQIGMYGMTARFLLGFLFLWITLGKKKNFYKNLKLADEKNIQMSERSGGRSNL